MGSIGDVRSRIKQEQARSDFTGSIASEYRPDRKVVDNSGIYVAEKHTGCQCTACRKLWGYKFDYRANEHKFQRTVAAFREIDRAHILPASRASEDG